MTSKYSLLLIILSTIWMLGAFGCGSVESNPAMPSSSDLDMTQSPVETNEPAVIAVYDVTFDPETNTLEAVEARGADAHYDVTGVIAPHCSFVLTLYDPVAQRLHFDMSIFNPGPFTVYDTRVLFLATAASGYSLLNPDDYTKLFNPYGPDDVNPFRSFSKPSPIRKFSPGDTFTEPFEVGTPATVTLPVKFRLLVECSWPDNCQDPFEISNQTLSNPINSTISGTITLDVYDHQNNVATVNVDTTPITGGLIWLTNTVGTTWSGVLSNTAGASPGKYTCRITAESNAASWDLYDFIEIEVIPNLLPPAGWASIDYPLGHNGCGYDLGVIADPGGPRDSDILMVTDGIKNCDLVIKYDPYYTTWSNYVELYDYDPDNDSYQPYPIERIDAADDGAFSFTNGNMDYFHPDAATTIYNAQVWSVFDNTPALHLGPAPDESRYFFDLSGYDAMAFPADVCDDFSLGQYTLFSTGVTYSPEDLIFLGTMPSKYTYNMVKFRADMDTFAGIGGGLIDPGSILGIDVVESVDEDDSVRLYVLEDNAGEYQVEVYMVVDTAPGWGNDFVQHIMTIKLDWLADMDYYLLGHDIEILPPWSDYELNPTNPTLCVLVSWHTGGSEQGAVLLYDAMSGTFLESIGDLTNPSMPDSQVFYLDTDDGDFEIHVTRMLPTGLPVATVFSYI